MGCEATLKSVDSVYLTHRKLRNCGCCAADRG
ncbi:hypothetical protein PMI37_00550, partial [Pseudomonas sp. GM80]